MTTETHAPSSAGQYHAILFDNRTEAAAFVAALSRFLNSPQAAAQRESIEVWSHLLPEARVELYLNNAAKNAAAQAFSPLRPARPCRADEFAAASQFILGGSRIPAWGIEEAERALLKQ